MLGCSIEFLGHRE